jgi:hypothetical protein
LSTETSEEQKLKIYVGLTEKTKPAILEAETEPNKESHPQYDTIYDPFKSKEDAEKYVKAMGELACGDG